MSARKAIITCAVTGSIHTPSMSPHLPITAEEIADAAVGAAEAGAAIIHLHARNPKDGRPDQSPGAFRPILESIKRRSDCVINITTGGAPSMTLEERLKPCAVFKPEVASLNMGSMNFGLFEMLKRYKTLKYDWEHTLLEGSRDRVFKNTFKDIEYILTTCAENGTRFEIECYDVGHLYTLAHFINRRLINPPFFVQGVFGILGGIQMEVCSLSASMGGNVRVGLEDSLWDGPGRLAESNAHQVRRVRRIIEGLGREIATPADARKMLELKGGARVAF
jgi:uncharacterized protein (DUF849 family)